jgi:dihydroflavonol-4-reductase
MKVLVTGATGFVGGWLVRRLLDEGHSVRIIKRANSSLDEIANLPIEIVSGDVTDKSSIENAVRGVDTVFHLAGLVAYTRAQRAAMERVNVMGTENVVKTCEKFGIQRLIYMSSVVAIGASFDGKKPLNEESEFNLHHLDLGYFETKWAAEKIVKAACDRGTLDAVILNPSTIYGSADAKKESRKTQLKVAQGRFPFYPPGGVSVVAVEDVIDATIAAWTKGKKGERYIVSGENLLIKEVFDLIAHEANVAPPWIPLPRPAIFAIGKMGDLMEKMGKKGALNTENAWTSVLYHWFEAKKAQEAFDLRFKPASYAIGKSVRWMRDNKIIELK